jgi:hypothetical protein
MVTKDLEKLDFLGLKRRENSRTFCQIPILTYLRLISGL